MSRGLETGLLLIRTDKNKHEVQYRTSRDNTEHHRVQHRTSQNITVQDNTWYDTGHHRGRHRGTHKAGQTETGKDKVLLRQEKTINNC